GALDPKEADVHDHLGPEPVVARREVDHRTRLAAVGLVHLSLPALDVGDDAVDHLADVLVRVSAGPGRDVVASAGHGGDPLSGRHGQPFTAPSVSPETMCRCR